MLSWKSFFFKTLVGSPYGPKPLFVFQIHSLVIWYFHLHVVERERKQGETRRNEVRNKDLVGIYRPKIRKVWFTSLNIVMQGYTNLKSEKTSSG